MVQIEKLEVSDYDSIKKVARLEQDIFPDPWSEKEVASTVGQKHTFCAIAKEKEEILGYFLCYFVLDEWEIARIAVSANARRKGIGQSLFDYMLKECEKKEIARLLLDVRESNVPAIRFYEKNGFTVDGIRKNFYGGLHPEHAILMSRQMGK